FSYRHLGPGTGKSLGIDRPCFSAIGTARDERLENCAPSIVPRRVIPATHDDDQVTVSSDSRCHVPPGNLLRVSRSRCTDLLPGLSVVLACPSINVGRSLEVTWLIVDGGNHSPIVE